MRSLNPYALRLFSSRNRFSLSSFPIHYSSRPPFLCHEGRRSYVGEFRCRWPGPNVHVKAFGDDSGASFVDDWGGDEAATGYVLSSSDGEDSDAEYVLNPLSDVDLPAGSMSSNDAITITAHRLAMIGKGRKKDRNKLGMLNTLALVAFLTLLLIFVDWCAWRIVRLPLTPFYLSRPFFISVTLVSFAGYFCVPILNDLKIHQEIRKEDSIRYSRKRATPTMGGLFFVPVGVGVAKYIAGFSSVEVSGVAFATLAFALIGLLGDILTLTKNCKSGLSTWIKNILEVAVGTWFSFWLETTYISSPYSMRTLVPLPAPVGLVCLGNCCYSWLSSFCFVSMGDAISLTDGLDGLVSGTGALALIGMSIAVLPICSELSIFGASMAGACVGFLLHNRYKASIIMGETGSLALGGALAAMAASTGMFFPLFISSGIFFLEASSYILQMLTAKATRRLLRIAPFQQGLVVLRGLKEPVIVGGAYVVSSILALLAGYLGLISA
ncbi:hypothetical protein K2173_006737 [Erythroxylum novogranatense]|uniref:Uncharacterized protein n=1 Tax=Erythroxylum novogranatense TaxID=1862640 RepID=A0AAV8T653_9ROSI|nr:hypothetical protein K2173_006737 [Erythroxylum novogranatense]